MADQEARKRDERWYFGMESTTAKTSSWRQCRYCRAYAESPSGQSVPFVHLAPCPVGELEGVLASPGSVSDQGKA